MSTIENSLRGRATDTVVFVTVFFFIVFITVTLVYACLLTNSPLNRRNRGMGRWTPRRNRPNVLKITNRVVKKTVYI